MATGTPTKVIVVQTSKVLTVLGTVWMLGLLALDFSILTSAFSDLSTLNYLPTPGQIVMSRVRHDQTQDYKTHAPRSIDIAEISYLYDIGGKPFRGRRISTETSSGLDPNSQVRAYPLGQNVTVYYDPAKPEDSVLSRGLKGLPFLLLLFTMPLHSAGMLILLASRRRPAHPETGGLLVVEQGAACTVSVPPPLPATDFLWFFALFSAPGSFVGALYLGMDASPGGTVCVWLGVVAGTAAVVRMRRRREREFIVLNRVTRELSIPNKEVPDRRRQLPYASLRRVAVARPELVNVNSATRRDCAVEITTAAGESYRIFNWRETASAEIVATWLRTRIGLPEDESGK